MIFMCISSPRSYSEHPTVSDGRSCQYAIMLRFYKRSFSWRSPERERETERDTERERKREKEGRGMERQKDRDTQKIKRDRERDSARQTGRKLKEIKTETEKQRFSGAFSSPGRCRVGKTWTYRNNTNLEFGSHRYTHALWSLSSNLRPQNAIRNVSMLRSSGLLTGNIEEKSSFYQQQNIGISNLSPFVWHILWRANVIWFSLI